MILNFSDWWDQMPIVAKSRQGNDMFDYTGAVYAEHETELSWQTDYGLRLNLYWTTMIDGIKYHLS